MTTEQIYSLVNQVSAQALGTQALAVTDAQSLVSLGNVVLNSTTNTEAFLNTLAQRIGRTIMSYRAYKNRLRDMVLNDFEYGAILQKIAVQMPEAVADPTYSLTDGQSVDQWIVSKPDVNQKLFVKRTPYMFQITIQEETLREAFLSESSMASFIGVVMGEVRNAIEIALENLGRQTIANFIAEASGTGRMIDLSTAFTAAGYTSTPSLQNPEFLRFAIQTINNTIDMLQEVTVLYNDGTKPRFTPKEDMRIKLASNFIRAAETVTEYAAFNRQFIETDGVYDRMTFWQSAQTPDAINVNRASDGAATNVTGIIGVIYDRDALGIYQKRERIATTPVNARALYYNQFWHERQLWFNDLSENFVVFKI